MGLMMITIINFIIYAVIAIAFLVLSISFLVLITRNMRQGRVVRELLAERVETLRMSKMLRALGIDFSQYLHTVPLNKINDSMNKCESCPTIEQCDDELKGGAIKAENIDFCPNQECLSKFTELNKKDP